MSEQVVTITRAEAAEIEEEGNERIEDDAFVPVAPLAAKPAAYAAGTTYAKGAYVEDPGFGFFRSQAAGNKGNTPHEDADAAHWAPVSLDLIQLQNPSFGGGGGLKEHTYESPPVSSAATATAAETVNAGSERALS